MKKQFTTSHNSLFLWYLLQEYIWLHRVLDLCCGYSNVALLNVCCVRSYFLTAVVSIQVRIHVCTKKNSFSPMLTLHMFENLQ